MSTPLGTWLVLPLSLATFAWSFGGKWYLRRHLLAGLEDAAALGRQHLEWSRSSDDLLGKKLHLAKARHHTAPMQPRVQRAKHWEHHVYRRVSYGLAYATAACALWGVASVFL